MFKRLAKYRIPAGSKGSFDITISCPVCEREYFIPTISSWAYRRKLGDKLVTLCSYTCARTVDRIMDEVKFYKNGTWKFK